MDARFACGLLALAIVGVAVMAGCVSQPGGQNASANASNAQPQKGQPQQGGTQGFTCDGICDENERAYGEASPCYKSDCL
jgi:hypothetical protein